MEDEQMNVALSFLQPDETAAQFLVRSIMEQISTGVPFIDHRAPLRSSSVVEICGLASTGKSQILYSVAATCVLPRIQDGISYGGHGSNIIYFDLDCKFDIVRFAQILQNRISASRIEAGVVRLDSTQSDDAVVSLVREAASRLHLISCPSSFHFLAALKILKPFAATLAQQSGLAAVLVDNVAAHYYLDRTVKGPPSTTTSTTTTGVSLTLMKVHIAMATGLKNLQHSLRVPVIATKHVFSNVTSSGGYEDAWEYRDAMLKPWQDYVTHRLILRRIVQPMDGGGGGSEAGMSRVAHWVKPEIVAEDAYEVCDLGVL